MKSKNKYYAVANGRHIGIFNTWNECKRLVEGFSNSKYKSFEELEDAKNYLLKNGINLKDIKINGEQEKINRICTICQKPYKSKGWTCGYCRKRMKALKEKNINVSVRKVSYLHDKYKSEDIFSLIEEHPNILWEVGYYNREAVRTAVIDKREHRRNTPIIENENDIPDFLIKQYKNTSMEVLKVSGNRMNPYVHLHCKKCDETISITYEDSLKHPTGHECISNKSTGEILVEEYLRERNIKYKTQRNTLKCINPDTNLQLPYDFELPLKKVIIEVQGEQHGEFIPRFHMTEEGFLYQQKKDKYKKDFAISKGYKYIEIWYEDIHNGNYKIMIDNAICYRGN